MYQSLMVSRTTSNLTGGKFANGAVTGAFVHMFNDFMDKIAERVAFGDRSYKALAKNTRGAADYTALASGISGTFGNPISQVFSKIVGGFSMFFTYQANYYEYRAAIFKKEGMIMDILTTHTKYCSNSLGDYFYDKAMTTSAPYLFEY